MLNNTGIERKSYGNRKSILVDEMNSTSLPCMVTDTGVSEDEEGRKIVKAGTPVYGSLLERDEPMSVSGSGNPCGVILHDVDVSKGQANSQVVFFGTIDITKVDDDVVDKLKSAEPNLKMIALVSR